MLSSHSETLAIGCTCHHFSYSVKDIHYKPILILQRDKTTSGMPAAGELAEVTSAHCSYKGLELDSQDSH